MPDNYIKFPRPESIIFFENAIRAHRKVQSITEITKCYYKINRKKLSVIHVFVSNYYALSIADYYDILNEFPDIDCLITISNWNHVTQQAYEQGIKDGVGVFTMKEFMGALNYGRPYRYIRPCDKEDIK